MAQLLSHTSGVPDVLPQYSQILRSGSASRVTGDDVAEVLAASGMPLDFQPGGRFEYSNTGYMVLAVLVEAVSGQPLAGYLHDTFFAPLGMAETLLRTPDAEPAGDRRAFGFRPRPVGERRPLDQIPGFFIKGAGGLYSTVGDLLIWQNALNAGQVVSPALWRQATEPTQLSDGTRIPYGFAFNLKPDLEGARRISHGGDWRAFKSDLSYYPDTDVTVIQLTNNGEDDSVDANVPALAAIAAGRSPTLPRPSIQWDLYATLTTQGARAARTWFEAERGADPKRYEVNENELNALGYALLEQGDAPRAAAVFEMATLAFPESSNAFDSLADAQEAQGDLQSALASVRTALTLDPDSTALRERAERLAARLP